METWTIKKHGWLRNIPFFAEVDVKVHGLALLLDRRTVDKMLRRHFCGDWGAVCDKEDLHNCVTIEFAVQGLRYSISPSDVRSVYRTSGGRAYEVATCVLSGDCDVRRNWCF